MEADSIVTTV